METQPVTLNITSEYALLETVLVHTPGRELSLVAPENSTELLFEDLLFEEGARAEHQIMCRVFEKLIPDDGRVLQVMDLLRDTFRQEDARQSFVSNLARALPERNFRSYEGELWRLPPQELADFALTGRTELPLHAYPVPNLMFTRDLCAVVNDHVILSHPAHPARKRESLILKVILQYHPAMSAYADHLIELPPPVTFEGGDLLVAAPNTVMLGVSERTMLGGALSIMEALFERTALEHLLVVDIPKERASMHLDTLFTFCGPEDCVVFPPAVEKQHHNVLHFVQQETRGSFETYTHPNLKTALDELLEPSLTYTPCGGDDPLTQRREQWTDGANLFAIRPDVVAGYDRNRYTFEALADRGYDIVDATEFLADDIEDASPMSDRLALKLPGNELSRGRGGARCLTLPLARLPT